MDREVTDLQLTALITAIGSLGVCSSRPPSRRPLMLTDESDDQ